MDANIFRIIPEISFVYIRVGLDPTRCRGLQYGKHSIDRKYECPCTWIVTLNFLKATAQISVKIRCNLDKADYVNYGRNKRELEANRSRDIRERSHNVVTSPHTYIRRTSPPPLHICNDRRTFSSAPLLSILACMPEFVRLDEKEP